MLSAQVQHTCVGAAASLVAAALPFSAATRSRSLLSLCCRSCQVSAASFSAASQPASRAAPKGHGSRQEQVGTSQSRQSG